MPEARELIEKANAHALAIFPDEVTHDYEPPPGVNKHPLGKIVVDRSNLRFAFVIGAQFTLEEQARLLEERTRERDEADRRAGAAERENAHLREANAKRAKWLRDAKDARGYSDNTSFDTVWADTCALADRAEAAEAEVKRLREALDGILAADREALADHGAKRGIADCIDNHGQPYQSQFLADALSRARQAAQEGQER